LLLILVSFLSVIISGGVIASLKYSPAFDHSPAKPMSSSPLKKSWLSRW
jgi:hypothetical protein